MHGTMQAAGWRTPGTSRPTVSRHNSQHAWRSGLAGRAYWRCPAYTRPSLNPYDDDYEFSLTQFMVTLEKPIGLTLAPDPLTGQVYVQAIQKGLSADKSMMVRVGDQLLLVSAATAVLGDDMWPASDLQRTRWAINNRAGKVKLVLERTPASLDEGDVALLPPWYYKGREGITTWQVPELQLPLQFTTDVGGELADGAPGVGRVLSVSFNRCMAPDTPEQARLMRAGLLARRARAEVLLSQMSEAAKATEVDFVNPVITQLAAMDPARFQVGVPGTQPSPAPGSQNVLPFRRHGSKGSSSSSNSNNLGGGSSSSGGGGGNSTSAAAEQQQQQQQQQPDNGGGGSSNSQPPPAQPQPPPVPQQQQGQQQQQGPQAPQQQQQQQQKGAAGTGPWWPPDSIAIPVTAYRHTRLVQVLPWLMASTGPLLPADLTQLATSRALSCLLEMLLSTSEQGLLCNRGEPPPFSLPQEPSSPVPVLTPSDSPAPAPDVPPPLHPDAEQQQQQDLEQDAGLLAASLAGLAGPDMGFATAVAAAAAAAAAAERQASGSSSGGGGGVGSGSNGGGALPPGYATLQAHAILHCLADLQRLAVRRRWRGSGTTARFTSISSNVYGGSYNGYNTNTPAPSAASTVEPEPATAPGFPRRGWGLTPGPGGLTGPGSSSSNSRSGQQLGAQGVGSSGRGGRGEGPGSALGVLGASSRQLVLQCDGQEAWRLAGVLVAAWLHWCGGVDQAAAVDCVSKAMGITVDQVLLAEVRRLLLVRAKERFSRRILSWPYGGATAEVSGELVGGWTERVSMTRCTNPDGCLGANKGHFYLELKGLAPGRYHYKYIVDNTWAVDGLAPKVLDSQGNWNNVLEVSAPPRIETPEEQAHYAALQAMWSAFERKMHFKRGGHHSMSH